MPNFAPIAPMTFFASRFGSCVSIFLAKAIAPGRSIPSPSRTSRMIPAPTSRGLTLKALPIAAFTSFSVSALFFFN
jgi:hypothetical protein